MRGVERSLTRNVVHTAPGGEAGAFTTNSTQMGPTWSSCGQIGRFRLWPLSAQDPGFGGLYGGLMVVS